MLGLALTLVALSEQIDLEPGATADELRKAMAGIIIETASLSATYESRASLETTP